MARIASCVAVFAGVLLLIGCGGGGGPPMGKVTGKITLKGQPLEGAQVTFFTEGAPRAAIGSSDAQGVYQLTTFNPNDGAVVGRHAVTLVMPLKTGPTMSAEQPNAAYGEAMANAAKGIQQRDNKIPAKYANPATSGFTADVKKGANEFNFDIVP